VTTQLYPSLIQYPKVLVAPQVQLRQTWASGWVTYSDIEFVGARRASAGQDLGSCDLMRRYGRVAGPGETSFSVRHPLDLRGYWVRVRMYESGVWYTQWVGQIPGNIRDVFGAVTSGSTSIPTGIQRWRAYDPLQSLRKVFMSQSHWIGTNDAGTSDELHTVDWIPSVNERDKHNTLVGNRTATRWEDDADTYLFGGSSVWTRYDFAEYVLGRFANQSGSPTWTLGGQSSTLAYMSDTIQLRTTQSVADILRGIINPKVGLDFRVDYDDGEDELIVYVYSLSASATSYGGFTLPANASPATFDRGNALDVVAVRLVDSDDHNYSTIRVLGNRMVVCLSLRGYVHNGCAPSLVNGWTVGNGSQESEYLSGTGTSTDEAELHDKARKREKMENVFQSFVAPGNFDPLSVYARPTIYSNGTVGSIASPKWQNSSRRTLNWIPLFEGLDYSHGVPDVTGNPELMRPIAWVQEPESLEYSPVDACGMGLSALSNNWGIRVSSTPNHLLALNHFDGAAESETEPKYDYTKMACTIAIESDQRLKLEQTLAGGDGSVMEIEDDSAELWYLARGTIVGFDVDGTPQYEESGRVLRNDVDRLGVLMAGAISRYQVSRYRAEITIKGYLPWSWLCGCMLTVADAGNDLLAGPVTEVIWMHGEKDAQTIIRAGFAG